VQLHNDCVKKFYLSVYVNGQLNDIYTNYTVQVAVTVFCTGDEVPPRGSGTFAGTYNWYNYGTGTWYNGNNPAPVQYW